MEKGFDMPLIRAWNESALHISYLPSTSQEKSSKPYAYIIHLHIYLPASNPITAQTGALQQTCTKLGQVHIAGQAQNSVW